MKKLKKNNNFKKLCPDVIFQILSFLPSKGITESVRCVDKKLNKCVKKYREIQHKYGKEKFELKFNLSFNIYNNCNDYLKDFYFLKSSNYLSKFIKGVVFNISMYVLFKSKKISYLERCKNILFIIKYICEKKNLQKYDLEFVLNGSIRYERDDDPFFDCGGNGRDSCYCIQNQNFGYIKNEISEIKPIVKWTQQYFYQNIFEHINRFKIFRFKMTMDNYVIFDAKKLKSRIEWKINDKSIYRNVENENLNLVEIHCKNMRKFIDHYYSNVDEEDENEEDENEEDEEKDDDEDEEDFTIYDYDDKIDNVNDQMENYENELEQFREDENEYPDDDYELVTEYGKSFYY